MNAFQGYLEKMGSNFLVAAFIPSLAFVTACMVAFSPIIPKKVLELVQTSLNPIGQTGLILLLVAIMMGFTLTSLNTYIYKLFEGYFFFSKLPFFRALERKRARDLRYRRDKLAEQVKRLRHRRAIFAKSGFNRSKAKTDQLDRKVEKLIAQRDTFTTEYDLRYPPNERLILPTRLGNILRAAEAYPLSRYNIDSVPLWPRMVQVIDESYMRKVDASNDQCSFLLNSSLLSGIFAMFSFSASLYQGIIYYLKTNFVVDQLLYFVPTQLENPIYLQRAYIYLVIGFLVLVIAWFFYNASLYNVSQYGNMIRSSYDLFRFKLLEQLHLPLPKNIRQERIDWRKVSELISVGTESLSFDYPEHTKQS